MAKCSTTTGRRQRTAKEKPALRRVISESAPINDRAYLRSSCHQLKGLKLARLGRLGDGIIEISVATPFSCPSPRGSKSSYGGCVTPTKQGRQIAGLPFIKPSLNFSSSTGPGTRKNLATCAIGTYNYMNWIDPSHVLTC